MPTFVAVESMTATHVAFVVLLFGAAMLSAGLGVYALYVARSQPTHRRLLSLFAMLMFGAALWSAGDGTQLLVVDEESQIAIETAINLVTVVPPLAWLLFAMSYGGREQWLSRRTYVLLAVEPVLFAVLLATHSSHDLLWSAAALTETQSGSLPLLQRELGPAYIAHALYSYALVIFGAYVLLFRARTQDTTFRGQATLLTVGALVPMLSNVGHLSGAGTALNLTGAAFTVSGVAFWLAITRYRLLDVVPVARESVIEEMRDGYVVLDESDRVVDANPAAEQLLSTSLSVGQPVADVLPADADVLDDDDADERTEFVVGEGADRRFVDATISPVGRDDASRLLVLRDVTETRETEQRFQALIENASDIVAVLDDDGTVQYQSPSTKQVLGYDPEEMVGGNAFDYIHPADQADLATEFAKGIEEDRPIERVEYRVQHADGSWRVHESVARNLLDDPAVEGIVINTRDVTEHRAREQELAATNERLDRFASVVSHDLRNPLNVAEGYVELLEDHVEDETALQYLKEVSTSHDRMDRIVDDVLALARQGGEITETMPIELESAARAAWSGVDTDGGTLDVVESTTVDADRDQLARLLENLFRNAIEHGATAGPSASENVPRETTDGGVHGGEVTVTVGTLPERDGFYVADDGPGLPPELRERVFEPGVTSREGGTGLGLAIVADIAEAHGWTVELGDTDGGARFEFVTKN
ncbi:histidine kinase N-terminal 7TM domain-containing protein [Haloarchaeobius salinus]|uniref:histidine kinase N-terminal 7TM domain-containing protein n=1 Tax=Haloarchaeobius salinus TaxID=1198298 RepID=UPI00210A738E